MPSSLQDIKIKLDAHVGEAVTVYYVRHSPRCLWLS